MTFNDTSSESDELVLLLPDEGIRIDRWISYSFASDYVVASDSWTFSTTFESMPERTLKAMHAGAKVLLQINGKTQGGGYIASVNRQYGPHGGSQLTVRGYDVMKSIGDAGADPRLYQFNPTQTLADVLKTVLGDFGFTEQNIVISNDANRSIMTGMKTTTRKGKPLKATAIAHRLKPYPGEGVHTFLTRFLHRFGLWMFPSADQQQIIIDVPRFGTPAAMALIRKKDGSFSNVEDGGLIEDATNQPAAILATGFSEGGDESRSKLKCIIVNELTGLETDASGTSRELIPTGPIIGLISRYPEATYIHPRDVFAGYKGRFFRPDPIARPIYLHDQEAKSLEQLENFARRELATRQSTMWTALYTVKGHTQAGMPWAVDTMVDVDDDNSDLHGPMWVKGRTFVKGPQGTFTHLDLILPYTLSFGENELVDEGVATKKSGKNATASKFIDPNDPLTKDDRKKTKQSTTFHK